MPPVKRIQGSKNSRTRSAFGFPKNGATGPDQEGGVMWSRNLKFPPKVEKTQIINLCYVSVWDMGDLSNHVGKKLFMAEDLKCQNIAL